MDNEQIKKAAADLLGITLTDMQAQVAGESLQVWLDQITAQADERDQVSQYETRYKAFKRAIKDPHVPVVRQGEDIHPDYDSWDKASEALPDDATLKDIALAAIEIAKADE